MLGVRVHYLTSFVCLLFGVGWLVYRWAPSQLEKLETDADGSDDNFKDITLDSNCVQMLYNQSKFHRFGALCVVANYYFHYQLILD